MVLLLRGAGQSLDSLVRVEGLPLKAAEEIKWQLELATL